MIDSYGIAVLTLISMVVLGTLTWVDRRLNIRDDARRVVVLAEAINRAAAETGDSTDG